MPITDLNSVHQALANIKLESLDISAELRELLQEALLDSLQTTEDILRILRE